MITVYGISYKVIKYFELSMSSIGRRDIKFILLDSKSDNSTEILKLAKEKKKDWNIDTIISSSKNCKGNGLLWAYDNIPPEGDWFVFTDLDLWVPPQINWLTLLSKAMETSVLAGFSLLEDNYIPPNGGHSREGFGCWLMGINKQMFNQYLRYKANQNWLDGELRWFASTQGKVTQIPDGLYHLGWDLWKDDPEYFEEKRKGINWNEDMTGCEYQIFPRINELLSR